MDVASCPPGVACCLHELWPLPPADELLLLLAVQTTAEVLALSSPPPRKLLVCFFPLSVLLSPGVSVSVRLPHQLGVVHNCSHQKPLQSPLVPDNHFRTHLSVPCHNPSFPESTPASPAMTAIVCHTCDAKIAAEPKTYALQWGRGCMGPTHTAQRRLGTAQKQGHGKQRGNWRPRRAQRRVQRRRKGVLCKKECGGAQQCERHTQEVNAV